MLKQSSILLAGLIVCGCSADTAGPDWASDCQRNFSETSREYAACVEGKSASAMAASSAVGTSDAVTTTPEGTQVPYLEGKTEFSSRERTDGGP